MGPSVGPGEAWLAMQRGRNRGQGAAGLVSMGGGGGGRHHNSFRLNCCPLPRPVLMPKPFSAGMKPLVGSWDKYDPGAANEQVDLDSMASPGGSARRARGVSGSGGPSGGPTSQQLPAEVEGDWPDDMLAQLEVDEAAAAEAEAPPPQQQHQQQQQRRQRDSLTPLEAELYVQVAEARDQAACEARKNAELSAQISTLQAQLAHAAAAASDAVRRQPPAPGVFWHIVAPAGGPAADKQQQR